MIVLYLSKNKGIAFTWHCDDKRWQCHGDKEVLPVLPRTAAMFIKSERDHYFKVVVPEFLAEAKSFIQLAYEDYYRFGC